MVVTSTIRKFLLIFFGKVLAYTGPEIRFDNSLPEVLDVLGGGSSGAPTNEAISAAFTRRHRPSKRLVLFICMALVTVAVIAFVNVKLGPAGKKAAGTR